MQVSFLTLVANKLKRINSTANNSITYMKKKKGISKKKIKSIRTNSSKQNKNVVKNVKYKSPQKIDFSKYTFKIKSKLEDFKKTCFSKQKTCRVSNSKGKITNRSIYKILRGSSYLTIFFILLEKY